MLDKPCLCNGLKLISDIIDLYNEIGFIGIGGPISGLKSTPRQQENAYKIVSKLLQTISEKDLNASITELENHSELSIFLVKERFKREKDIFKLARNDLRKCKENRDMSCMFALEDMRSLIHQNVGIRAKLLCEDDIYSNNNKRIKEIMNTLRDVRLGAPIRAKFLINDMIKDVTCSRYFKERSH